MPVPSADAAHAAQLGLVAAQPAPPQAPADVPHTGLQARQRHGAHARQVLAQAAAVGHAFQARDALRRRIALQTVDVAEMAAAG